MERIPVAALNQRPGHGEHRAAPPRWLTAVLMPLALAMLAGCMPDKPSPPVTEMAPVPCPKSDVICASVYQPVCGEDGRTYSNACTADKACVKVAYEGECRQDTANVSPAPP